MRFSQYRDEDYQAVCDFLIALNQNDRNHINWNWARFEWMYEHPEFEKSQKSSIGLWRDEEQVVGAAIYDMYFGEAFCAALPGYETLYPDILDYAYRKLMDDAGLGIAICDDNTMEIEAAQKAGFTKAGQTETVMSLPLDRELAADLPDGLSITELDPSKEPYVFQWLLWQGFDHGTDKAEFEREEKIIPQSRSHLNKFLSLAAENADGEKVAYSCLWYIDDVDYAYIEPVCTIPSYRKIGAAKGLIHEALNRAKSLGARKAYVISDTEFYQRLGFTVDKHFTFYWKQEEQK